MAGDLRARRRLHGAVFAKLAVARQRSDFLGHLDSWTASAATPSQTGRVFYLESGRPRV